MMYLSETAGDDDNRPAERRFMAIISRIAIRSI